MNTPAIPAGLTLLANGGNSGITTGEVAVSPCFNSTNFAQDGTDGGF
ncbi:MAG: hypothetical protein IPI65_16490 [Bacteroidetes bacterium]|nr:hypothetical protein [Bacteroidota bacterium]